MEKNKSIYTLIAASNYDSLPSQVGTIWPSNSWALRRYPSHIEAPRGENEEAATGHERNPLQYRYGHGHLNSIID